MRKNRLIADIISYFHDKIDHGKYEIDTVDTSADIIKIINRQPDTVCDSRKDYKGEQEIEKEK